MKNNPRTTTREAPAVLGPLPPGMDTYERENRWLLDTALAHRPAPLAFIGGTRHMLSEVERRGARVHWLDTRALWSL